MVKGPKKVLFLSLGWMSLLLGFVGIFLPLLPTTPFALLAAYFFSQSSKKLHSWLLRQKSLGPLIYSWEKHGVIPIRAKILATVMMTILFSYSLIFVKVNLLIKAFVALTGISVLCFIWTRPSQKKKSELRPKAHDTLAQ
jgi:uncharacterized membrane protein YbaN (DUF454 family)